MTTSNTSAENGQKGEPTDMQTPPVVSAEAWETARQQLLVKEKAHTRARDALAAERRRHFLSSYAKLLPRSVAKLFHLIERCSYVSFNWTVRLPW